MVHVPVNIDHAGISEFQSNHWVTSLSFLININAGLLFNYYHRGSAALYQRAPRRPSDKFQSETTLSSYHCHYRLSKHKYLSLMFLVGTSYRTEERRWNLGKTSKV